MKGISFKNLGYMIYFFIIFNKISRLCNHVILRYHTFCKEMYISIYVYIYISNWQITLIKLQIV